MSDRPSNLRLYFMNRDSFTVEILPLACFCCYYNFKNENRGSVAVGMVFNFDEDQHFCYILLYFNNTISVREQLALDHF